MTIARFIELDFSLDWTQEWLQPLLQLRLAQVKAVQLFLQHDHYSSKCFFTTSEEYLFGYSKEWLRIIEYPWFKIGESLFNGLQVLMVLVKINCWHYLTNLFCVSIQFSLIQLFISKVWLTHDEFLIWILMGVQYLNLAKQSHFCTTLSQLIFKRTIIDDFVRLILPIPVKQQSKF